MINGGSKVPSKVESDNIVGSFINSTEIERKKGRNNRGECQGN